MRNRVHQSNSDRQENHIITKSSDSIDLWYQLFSNNDNLREQSKNNRIDKKFSISRSNQAHQYSNSLYQEKNDWRIDWFNLYTHESNDNWRINKITDQEQIRSISNRFRNKIRLVASNRNELTSCESLFQRSHHIFLYNLRSLLSVVFACKKRIRMKICSCIKKAKKTSFEILFFDRFLRKLKVKNRLQIMFCVRMSNQTIQKHDCDQVTWCD